MQIESLCKSCEYGDRNCPGLATNVFGCAQYMERKPRTNGDRIRAMTDEELAKKISGIEQFALTTDGAWSPEQWLDWLKQPEMGG